MKKFKNSLRKIIIIKIIISTILNSLFTKAITFFEFLILIRILLIKYIYILLLIII